MVVVILLARRLGPTLFGQLIFVQWLVDISAVACSGGLPSAASRFFPETAGQASVSRRRLERWLVRWSAVAVVLTGCVAATLAAFASTLSGAAALAAVWFWAASVAAWAILGARAQGLFQFRRHALSSVLLVAVLLIGPSLPASGDLLALLVCFGSGNFVAAAACLMMPSETTVSSVARYPTHGNDQHVRSFALNAWITALGNAFVWSRGEVSVVRGHLGESSVGLYSIGLTLSGIVNQGLGLLTGGLWSHVAREWDSGDRSALARLSDLVAYALMLGAGLLSGAVICFAPYLVRWLFGQAFVESINTVMVLALGPIGLASGSAHLVVQAATNGRFARNATAAGGLALFGGAYFLVPNIGDVGAALSRATTQLGVAALTFVVLARTTANEAAFRTLRAFMLVVALAVSLVVVFILQPDIAVGTRLIVFAVYSCFVWLVCNGFGENRAFKAFRYYAKGANA